MGLMVKRILGLGECLHKDHCENCDKYAAALAGINNVPTNAARNAVTGL
jgi:hypothetical protein